MTSRRHIMKCKFDWTTEAVEHLRVLIEVENRSAGEATHIMNKTATPTLSRNAVMGKAKRMGFKFAASPGPSWQTHEGAASARERREPSRPRAISASPKPRKRTRSAPPILTVVEFEGESSGPLRFIDRKRSQCAWPLSLGNDYGLAEMLVCGAPVRAVDGDKIHSYCHKHHVMGHAPFKLKQPMAPYEATVVRSQTRSASL